MPSQEVTLPSFDELIHSLNDQNPLTVNHHGHQKIPGPLGPQHQWLKQALGVVLENHPLGRGYSVLKPPETRPPSHEKQDCSDSGCCSLLNRWSPFPRIYVDSLKTQGKYYTVYLHRPKWDECTSLPVIKSIPFISNDPIDQEFGLPGVSIIRLLAMEPGILADSNSVVLDAQSLWPTRAWSPQVRVKGHPRVKYRCYNNTVEYKHAVLIHLGLAYI